MDSQDLIDAIITEFGQEPDGRLNLVGRLETEKLEDFIRDWFEKRDAVKGEEIKAAQEAVIASVEKRIRDSGMESEDDDVVVKVVSDLVKFMADKIPLRLREEFGLQPSGEKSPNDNKDSVIIESESEVGNG